MTEEREYTFADVRYAMKWSRLPREDRKELLSPRELEIARLVGKGLTNEEIAAQECVSIETVKTQVRAVIAKTGAKNRTHAVAILIRGRVI